MRTRLYLYTDLTQDVSATEREINEVILKITHPFHQL